MVKKEIEDFISAMNENDILGLSKVDKSKVFNTSCSILMEKNAHFLRARVLNSFFENLKDWFNANCPKEWGRLHTENWLQVLYLLRNIVSHSVNSSKKIAFLKRTKNNKWLPESYPKVINWKTITITEDQFVNTVRFNDYEILELLKYGIAFLEKNREKYI